MATREGEAVNFNITQHKAGWGLRKGNAARTRFYRLRREALAAAKKDAGPEDVIYVRNSRREIVVRIPELG